MASVDVSNGTNGAANGGKHDGAPPARIAAVAQQCADFLHKSPTPFHMCREASKMLTAAGFKELSEDESWIGDLKRGGKYFYRRNGSTLVAFAVGSDFTAGTGGIAVVGSQSSGKSSVLEALVRATRDAGRG